MNLRAGSEMPFYNYSRCCLAAPRHLQARPAADSSLPWFSLSCKDVLFIAVVTVWLAARCKGSLSHIPDSKSQKNSAAPGASTVTDPAPELKLLTRERWYYLWASERAPGKQSRKLYLSSPELGSLWEIPSSGSHFLAPKAPWVWEDNMQTLPSQGPEPHHSTPSDPKQATAHREAATLYSALKASCTGTSLLSVSLQLLDPWVP